MDMKTSPNTMTPKITTHLRNSLRHLTTLLISTVLSLNISQAATQLDRIAAIVDDDIVMLSDVQTQARRLRLQKSLAGLSDKAIFKEALELLIMDSLQTQKAKQFGITIGDSAVNATMMDLAQRNKLSLEQFQEALKHEKIDYVSFREQIRKQMLIGELRKRQLRRNTHITDQAVNDLIANQSAEISKGIEYQIKHILIPAPTGTPLASLLKSKQDAEQLRSHILKGESNRLENIKTSPWRSSSTLPPSYLRNISLLEKGQLSEVFQDSKGFHIVKLIDKRGVKKVVVNEVHARHILLKNNANKNDATLKSKLAEIRNQILAGADFASIAKQYSEDSSAVSGGDLGWASSEAYVPAFAKVVETIPVNEISQPFKSKFGWHIVQVLEKKTIDNTEGMLRNQAKGLLNKDKASKEYDSWLKQLRNDAFVEYRIKAQ